MLYLSANQDSWAEAQTIGIDPQCVADFDFGRDRGFAAAMAGVSARYVDAGSKGFLEAERRGLKGRSDNR